MQIDRISTLVFDSQTISHSASSWFRHLNISVHNLGLSVEEAKQINLSPVDRCLHPFQDQPEVGPYPSNSLVQLPYKPGSSR